MTRSTSRDQNAVRTQQRKARRLMTTTALAAAGVIGMTNQAMALDPGALPTGEQVVGGAATFDRSVTNVLDVRQSTNRAVINWDSFNIGGNATTQFYQPNSGSLTVNRVVGNSMDPSQILGTLKANGQLMILDRNGVLFGAHSRIDVGSIVASTGDVDTNAVMRGDSHLTLSNFGSGSIVNDGDISVSDAGLAAFVAPAVSNNGTINAKLGKVALAGANGDTTATVDLYGDGLVELAPGGNTGKVLAENTGTINAEGGTVVMSAAAAKGAVDDVINMSGVIQVSSVTEKGGEIILGGGEGNVKVSGKLDASGKTGGGSVKVSGNDITVDSSAFVMADAYENGNGGTVGLFAGNNALYHGNFYARGGLFGGNGGSIELSAANQMGYDGSSSTYAANGISGSTLLDPLFAIIHSGSLNNPLGLGYVLSAQSIADDMGQNGNYTVQATSNIDVGTNLPGLGNGAINVSHYDHFTYDFLGTYTHLFGPIYIPNYGWVNHGGTTTGNLTLQANTVTFNKDLTLGTGNLDVQASTVNLNARLYDLNGLLGQGDITTTANTVSVLSNAALIQQGVYLAAAGGTVNVNDGTYSENVNVNKSLTLQSSHGRDATAISGIAGTGALGTVVIGNGINNVTVGTAGHGFTVEGFDSASAGIENAALYLQGAHDGITVRDNKIVAKGDEALLAEYGQANDHLTIDGNTFGGNTFTGADGAWGMGDQFTVPNVPRQLVALNSGVKNVTFSNNIVEGNSGDRQLVAIESQKADIFGNSFDGLTTASALRVRGSDINAYGNTIDGNGRGIGIEADKNGFNLTIGSTNATKGNVINNTGDDAIKVSNATGATTIQNNVIGYKDITATSGDASNIHGDGIYVSKTDGVVIKGNKITETQFTTPDANGSNGNGIQVVDTSGATIGGAGTGEGNSVSNTHNGDGIRLQNDSNVTADHNSIANAGRVGIWGGNVTNAAITNNTVNGAHLGNYGAIEGDGGSNWTVSGNDVDNADYGIVLNGTSGTNKIKNNTVDNTGSGIYVTGVNGDADHVTGVDIDGNFVGMNGNIANNGVLVANSANARVLGNTIDGAKDGVSGSNAGNLWVYNNDITGSSVNGVHVAGSAGILYAGGNGSDVDIWRNRITGAAGSTGILVENSAFATVGAYQNNYYGADGIAMGNVISGVKDGIVIKDSAHAAVSYNTVSGVSGNGITIDPSDYSIVAGNAVTGGVNGIYSLGNSHVMIGGAAAADANIVSGASSSDILVDGGSDNTVQGNVVNGGATGIRVQNTTTGTKVTGNTVGQTTGSGIEVAGAANGTTSVSGNHVYNAGWDGINVQGAGNVSVTGNDVHNTTGASGVAFWQHTGGGVISGNTVENSARLGIYEGFTDGVNVTGNTVTNSGTGHVGTFTDGIFLEQASNVTVDGNIVDTTAGDGIRVGGEGNAAAAATTGITVKNNKVAHTGADGVAVIGSDSAQITGNKVGYLANGTTSGGADNIGGDGIFVSRSDSATIASNTVTETHSATGGKGAGINVVDSDHVMIGSTNSANGNKVSNADGDGIRVVTNTGTADHDTIQNNTVTNAARVGVYSAHATSLLIDGNTVDGATFAIGTHYGAITSDWGSDITVSNNKVKNSTDGIMMYAVGGTNRIDGNKIDWLTNAGVYANTVAGLTVNNNKIGQHAVTGTNGKTVAGDGIDILNSGTAQITGNTVTASQVGIFIDPSDGSTVTGNTVTGGTTGIYSLNNSNVTIGGAGSLKNTVSGSSVDGIRVDGGTGNKVLGNNVTGTGRDGVHAEGTSGLTVQNNVVYKNGDDGIDVSDAASAQILSNTVGKSGGSNKITDNGIEVTDSASANVQGNTITNVGANGIFVDPSPNAVIAANTISNTGANGIYSLDNDSVTIGGTSDAAGNSITGAGANGILVSGGGNALVQYNKITGGNAGGSAGAALDGIRVDDNDGVRILNNTIAAGQGVTITLPWYLGGGTIDLSGGNGANGNGIAVYGSNNAAIDQNTVTPDLLGNGLGAGNDGIHVENSNNLTVGGLIPLLNGNKIFSTGGDGIHIDGSNGVSVLNNIVSGASIDLLGFELSGEIGGDGIDMNHTTGSLVAGNIITNTGSDGIRFNNGTLSLMALNFITGAGANGIDVSNSGLLALLANNVSGAHDDGISLNDTYLTLTAANTVSDAGDDGIDLNNALGAAVTGNTVSGSADNGIEASHFALGMISGNTVSDAGNNGIDLDGAALVSVKDNTVTDAGYNGINAAGLFLSSITGNDVSGSYNDGISANGGAFVKIDGNDVEKSGHDGINAANIFIGSIGDNDVKRSGHDGIALNGGAFINVDGNTVARSHHDGIAVDGLFGGSVDDNTVKLSGKDGISVKHAQFTDVDGNSVAFSGRNGIVLADNAFVTASDNKVFGAGRDGIHADHNIGLGLYDNFVGLTGDDGIDVRNSGGARIVGNHTAFTLGDGIQVRNSDNVRIRRNEVRFAGDDGIDVEGSNGARISHNDVAYVAVNGIEVSDSDYVRIARNDVAHSGNDGINVEGGNFLLVKANNVSNSGADGIDVRNVGSNSVFDGFDIANGDYAVRISGNSVTASGRNGIEGFYNGWTKIDGNTVIGSGEDGIFVVNGQHFLPPPPSGDDEPSFFALISEGGESEGSSLVEILNNTVDNAGDNGIEVVNTDYSLIDGNKVGLGVDGIAGTEDDSTLGNDGIRVASEGNDPTFIQNNLVSNAAFNGIEINGVDEAHILSNVITNSGANGFFASGPNNGTVTLANNTFTDNTVGAKFESGLIDLTGDANTFNGGEVGMLFAPFQFFQGEGEDSTPSYAYLELAQDTAGVPTIGTSIFNGQSKYYVELDNGAFFDPGTPTILNGLNATYDGFSPASTGGVLTQAQYNAIEAKMFHYVDDQTLGLFFFGAVPDDSGSVDQKDIFRVFGGFAPGGGGLTVTITGLPNVPGGRTNFNVINTPPTNVANIEPAAGGDDNGDAGVDITGIEPAAGTPSGKDNSCWGDAIQGAGGGTPVSYSFAFGGGSEALSQAAGCQTGKL